MLRVMSRCVPIAMLAVATLAGCVTVARMVVPAGMSERAERVEVTGLGTGTRGRTAVLGQSLEFTRGATRLALFDETVVTDRGRVDFSLQAGGQPAWPVNCGMKQRSVTLGVLGFDAKPFAFECTLGGVTPATLSVQESRAGVRTLKAERRGELRFDGRIVALRSVHEVQGGALPLAVPIGYAFEEAGRPVAAVEINGVTPVLLLPGAGDASLRQRVLQAALALALLWDPAGAS
jgi:hypothetical protein